MPTISNSRTIRGAYGAPLRFAGVPVDGTSGTFKGTPKGKQLVNTLTGDLYLNEGSASSPTWVLAAAQSV